MYTYSSIFSGRNKCVYAYLTTRSYVDKRSYQHAMYVHAVFFSVLKQLLFVPNACRSVLKKNLLYIYMWMGWRRAFNITGMRNGFPGIRIAKQSVITTIFIMYRYLYVLKQDLRFHQEAFPLASIFGQWNSLKWI